LNADGTANGNIALNLSSFAFVNVVGTVK
jgi:hypothetical protein